MIYYSRNECLMKGIPTENMPKEKKQQPKLPTKYWWIHVHMHKYIYINNTTKHMFLSYKTGERQKKTCVQPTNLTNNQHPRPPKCKAQFQNLLWCCTIRHPRTITRSKTANKIHHVAKLFFTTQCLQFQPFLSYVKNYTCILKSMNQRL